MKTDGKECINKNCPYNDVSLEFSCGHSEEPNIERCSDCIENKEETITEIDLIVRESIKYAREVVDGDKSLMMVCDELEMNWNFIIQCMMSTAIAAVSMKYKTPEEIKKQLSEYLVIIMETEMNKLLQGFTPNEGQIC